MKKANMFLCFVPQRVTRQKQGAFCWALSEHHLKMWMVPVCLEFHPPTLTIQTDNTIIMAQSAHRSTEFQKGVCGTRPMDMSQLTVAVSPEISTSGHAKNSQCQNGETPCDVHSETIPIYLLCWDLLDNRKYGKWTSWRHENKYQGIQTPIDHSNVKHQIKTRYTPCTTYAYMHKCSHACMHTGTLPHFFRK